MPSQSDNQKSKILEILSAENSSMSISMIAQKSGINRHTVARHLDILEMFGKVKKVEKGVAKKYMIIEDFPISGLIDLSEDLIIILDSNLYIQYLNNAALKFFKSTLSGSVGKKISDLSLPYFTRNSILDELTKFTFKKPIILEIKNDDQRWFQITILGYSLLHAPNQIAIIFTDITLKKKIENDLKIAQEKYSIAFQSSPDAIIISDFKTGELIEANEATCTITGYTREDLIGHTTHELGIFKDPSIRDRIIQNHKTSGLNSRFETEIVKKSGETAYISIVVNKINIGEQMCLLSSARDITEKKEAELKIQKSEELYRLLADNTQDVIWILDITTQRFTYVSPSVYRLRGYTPEEVLTQPMQEVMTKESYEKITNKVPQIIQDLKNGIISPYNTSRVDQIRKDGTIVPTEVVTSFLRDSTGKYSHVLGVSRDISVRLTIEEKLKQSESQYKFLAESIKDVVWIVDPVSLILKYVSPSVLGLLGYSPEELISGGFEIIIPSVILDNVTQTIRERYHHFVHQTQERSFFTEEIQTLTKSGDKIWVEISSQFSLNPTSSEVQLVGIIRDISEKKMFHEELLESEAKYRLVSENVHDLIWMISAETQKILFVSPSIQNFYGFLPNEVIGKPFSTIIPKPQFDAIMKRFHRKITLLESGDESKRYSRFEIEHPHRDGHRMIIEISATLITDSTRKVINILGLSRDITEEKNNKHALQKSEAMFKSIFNESPISHILCDHYGKIIQINQVLMDEFGIQDNSALVGQCIWNIIPLTNEEHIAILSGNKISHEITISFDYLWENGLIPTNKSRSVIFDMKITPLLTMTPDEVGYLIHLLNITEKRKIELELKNTYLSLQNANDTHLKEKPE